MRRFLSALAVVFALLSLPLTTPAQAAPAAAPGTSLVLSWDYLNGDGDPHVVTLNCSLLPLPGGSHPDPIGACFKLTLVGGDFYNLPNDLRLCTAIYRPVVLLATGTWNGQPAFYIEGFDNPCLAARGTNGVFAF